MRWLGHVFRRGKDTEIGRAFTMEVTGVRGKGKSARQWKNMVENDMRVLRFEKGIAVHRESYETMEGSTHTRADKP